MTDLPLYDVTAICRDCGAEFPSKSFVRRTADNPPIGVCDGCWEKDQQKIAALKQPPKSHGKPKTHDPSPQYRWEPKD